MTDVDEVIRAVDDARAESLRRSLRDPERINERAADLRRPFHYTGAVFAPIFVEPNISPGRERERVVRSAWWDVHYNGEPPRDQGRLLALIRFLAAGRSDEELEQAFIAVAMRDGAQEAALVFAYALRLVGVAT